MGKYLALVTVIMILCVSSLTYLGSSPKVNAYAKEDFVVVVDAGHGGVDPGVISSVHGEKESNLNLYLAKNLSERFLADGNFVVMTRTSDNGLYGSLKKGYKSRDLKRRVEICKESNADVFISIHMNKYSDKSRRGAQVFYSVKNQEGKTMARYIQDQLNGLDEAVRICTPLAGDYYLLNNLDCPAVIVECGFLSNALDEELLLTESYREKLAHAIYYGVKAYAISSENL